MGANVIFYLLIAGLLTMMTLGCLLFSGLLPPEILVWLAYGFVGILVILYVYFRFR